MRKPKIATVLLGLVHSAKSTFALDVRDGPSWYLSDDSKALTLWDEGDYLLYAGFFCPPEDWGGNVKLHLAPVDHKVLGRRIVSNDLPEIKLPIDGKDFASILASLDYDYLSQTWAYEVSVNPEILQALKGAKSLAIKGTGLNLILPVPKTSDVEALMKACALSD